MIRQAISCDICGAEKKQTNHWFVAYESAGELRVSGWSTRNRLRPGTKHLCGQACLHKLVDDFMARVIGEKSAARSQADVEETAGRLSVDTSLTTAATFAKPVPPPRPLKPPEAERPHAAFRPELVVKPEPDPAGNSLAPRAAPPRFATPTRRAEAWERERERAARASERAAEIVTRRISQA